MRPRDIPRREWPEFLAEFGRRHRSWLLSIEGATPVVDEPLDSLVAHEGAVLVRLRNREPVRKQKQIRDMQTQLPAIINEAFGAIEKQLKKTVALRRHEEKVHDGEPRGLVEKLFAAEGYGFIRTVDGGRQFYFHRNSVLHDDFARLSVGTEVRFNPEQGDEGPQASSVQIVAK